METEMKTEEIFFNHCAPKSWVSDFKVIRLNKSGI